VTQIKVDSTTRRLIITGTPRKISDFDKNALEEAVRVKEKLGGEVVALTVSAEDAKTTLREALAMGADKAYLITDPSLQDSDALVTSYVLAQAVKKISSFDLILCGEATIDSYSAQVGPRLAERLDIPAITYARKLSIEGNHVIAERSLEDRFEVAKARMPALVSVTKEINEPRIPSLPAILKASKKELVTWNLEDVGVSKEKAGTASSSVQILEVLAPKVERRQVKIEGESPQEIAEKLVRALIQEGVVGR
jgi:electron transfer flavoprotein beta subunit